MNRNTKDDHPLEFPRHDDRSDIVADFQEAVKLGMRVVADYINTNSDKWEGSLSHLSLGLIGITAILMPIALLFYLIMRIAGDANKPFWAALGALTFVAWLVIAEVLKRSSRGEHGRRESKASDYIAPMEDDNE